MAKFVNSVASILSRGGEIFGAYLLNRKQSAFDTFRAIQKKFGPADDSVINDVVGFSAAMLAAGAELSGSAPNQDFDLDRIPTNPYLFGSDTRKGRIIIGSVYGVRGSEQKFNIHTIHSASVSINSILQMLEERIPEWAKESPERFGAWRDRHTAELFVQTWFAEKQG